MQSPKAQMTIVRVTSKTERVKELMRWVTVTPVTLKTERLSMVIRTEKVNKPNRIRGCIFVMLCICNECFTIFTELLEINSAILNIGLAFISDSIFIRIGNRSVG